MTGNVAFGDLVDEFIRNEFETSPVMATYHGKTEYDDRLDDFSAAAFHKRDADAQEWFDRFEAAGDGLSADHEIDRQLALATLRGRSAALRPDRDLP